MGLPVEALRESTPMAAPIVPFSRAFSGPNDTVRSVAVQEDGKILSAGGFTAVNGITRNRIARLNPDGSLDDSFSCDVAGPNGWVHALALQSDGKILLGGWFNMVNGAARTNLARLNPDGSLDSSFSPSVTSTQGWGVLYTFCM